MGFIVVGFYGFYFFLLSMRLPTNFTSYFVHSLVESTKLHVPYELPTTLSHALCSSVENVGRMSTCAML
jgi:hypothetical protein